MFSFFKKPEEPAFARFMPLFHDTRELLGTLATSENGRIRPFDAADLSISASAVVGAAFMAKKSGALIGDVSEEEVRPLLDEIHEIFPFVSVEIMFEKDQQSGEKTDPNSEAGRAVMEEINQAQVARMGRYLGAMTRMANPEPGEQPRHFLALAVQNDIYHEEIADDRFLRAFSKLVMTMWN